MSGIVWSSSATIIFQDPADLAKVITDTLAESPENVTPTIEVHATRGADGLFTGMVLLNYRDDS